MLLVILLGPTLRRVSYLMSYQHWNAVKGYLISAVIPPCPSLPLFQNS